jgi:hypothetical protein
MGIWLWVGIGCLVLVLLAIGTCFAGGMFLKKKVGGMVEDFEKNPAKAAAELAVKLNPEVELVRSDETTMTVRHRETGEEITVSFEDAKEGKFTFTTKEGTATIDADAARDGEGGTLTVTDDKGQVATFGAGSGAGSAPAWLPLYPGAEVVGNYDADTPEGHAGALTVTTADGLAEVMKFYEDRLRADGFEVQKMTYEGDSSGGTVTGSTADQKRSVSVVLSFAEGKTQAMVTFNEQR